MDFDINCGGLIIASIKLGVQAFALILILKIIKSQKYDLKAEITFKFLVIAKLLEILWFFYTIISDLKDTDRIHLYCFISDYFLLFFILVIYLKKTIQNQYISILFLFGCVISAFSSFICCLPQISDVFVLVLNSFCSVLFITTAIYSLKTLDILFKDMKLSLESLKEVNFQKNYQEIEKEVLYKQLDPHFIFNNLSTIKLLVVQANISDGPQSLSAFSRFLRMVLSNSRHKAIFLKMEAEYICIYTDIQLFRLKNKTTFSLKITEETQISELLVPPFIFQPFIENAIWHSLIIKSENGDVSIKILLENSTIILNILENNVSNSQKKDFLEANKSAVAATEERLFYFNKDFKTNCVVKLFLQEGILENKNSTIIHIST